MELAQTHLQLQPGIRWVPRFTLSTFATKVTWLKVIRVIWSNWKLPNRATDLYWKRWKVPPKIPPCSRHRRNLCDTTRAYIWGGTSITTTENFAQCTYNRSEASCLSGPTWYTNYKFIITIFCKLKTYYMVNKWLNMLPIEFCLKVSNPLEDWITRLFESSSIRINDLFR